MKKHLSKLVMILTLAVVIGLPGLASADYVQTWVENGWYGVPPAQQTWDKAEAFLVSGGTWTEPGLTIAVGTWAATLINPTYALATGPTFNSVTQGNFNFTTYATDRTSSDPFVFDWILWNGDTIVGIDRLTWTHTPGDGWTLTEFQVPAAQYIAWSSGENRSQAPLPPTLLLLGSGLVGLGLLRRWRKAEA
jgi:hypothetical protein